MTEDLPVPANPIDRPGALSWLSRWKGKDLIKVITGVRRCGKSAVLAMFAQTLESDESANIIKLNFENPDHADLLEDPVYAYREIVKMLQPGVLNYVFLDEVQLVKDYERMADGLFIRQDVDLYITGSNADMLSGELATLLSGRYIELKMFPLSFAEYVAARLPSETDLTSALIPRQNLYAEYTASGGFPYTFRVDAVNDRNDYLLGILNTILLKDIAARQAIRDVPALERVVSYIAANIGGLASDRKIAGALTSAGHKIAPQTVANYLHGMAEAFLFYPAQRVDLRSKEILEGPEKQYIVDPGLRQAIAGSAGRNTGHILENIIYLELLRRGRKVQVGKIDSKEVDFVVDTHEGRHYYQVSATVRNEETYAREMAPLQAINDNYPKTLLTLDDDPESQNEGILQQNALVWLLS
jgi:predicted AAA+ superfamily ATPase